MPSPSKEQIKKFWEWCGFKYEDYSSPAFPHMGGAWIGPNGKTIMDADGFTDIPSIDLNNLFKYAVPKLGAQTTIHFYKNCLLYRVSIMEGYDAIRTLSFSEDVDPALALFWAIWEVINGE